MQRTGIAHLSSAPAHSLQWSSPLFPILRFYLGISIFCNHTNETRWEICLRVGVLCGLQAHTVGPSVRIFVEEFGRNESRNARFA